MAMSRAFEEEYVHLGMWLKCIIQDKIFWLALIGKVDVIRLVLGLV